MKLNRTAGFLVALCLIVSMFTACAYNPETVMTIDGTEIKAGVYLYYQLMTVMTELPKASGDETAQPQNILQDNRDIEGVAARDWVQNKTLEYCKIHVFIDREFKRLGLSFSSVLLGSYQSTIQEEWANGQDFLLRNGVSYESFEEVMINSNYKRSAISEALYKYGGEKEISKEEYETYFAKHYTKLDYFSIPLVVAADGSPLIEQFENLVAEAAQEIVESANQTTLARAYINIYPKIAEILGDETEINAESFEAANHVDVVTNDTATTPNEDLIKEIFAVEDSEEKDTSYKVFHKTGTALIIYRVVGLTEDNKYKDYETALRNAILKDPYDRYIKDSITAFSVDIQERARKYYSVDKIKFS